MTSPSAPLALKCPVCAAAFRGSEICPRCGTQLQPLMRIAARAWALRQISRAKLLEGDLHGALRHAAAAWRFQSQGDSDFLRSLKQLEMVVANEV